MAESRRAADMKAEKALSQYMDRCFYERLCEKIPNASFDRKTDAKTQLEGVDIELTIDGTKYFIDEKASLYYSNTMLPTFAFEIDSLQRNHPAPIPGWFVNKDLKTTHYLLIWPNVKCIRPEDQPNAPWQRVAVGKLLDSDFTIVEALLIKKSDLLAALNQRGLSVGKLQEDAASLRRSMAGANERMDKRYPEANLWLTYSGTIKEQPLNLVINKEFLKPLATGIWLISEDGYAAISQKAPFEKPANAIEQLNGPHAAPESLEALDLPERCNVTMMAKTLDEAKGEGTRRKITAVLLNELLVDNGYLKVIDTADGRTQKAPTQKGEAAGIKAEQRQTPDGTPYLAVSYNQNAQRIVLDLLSEHLASSDC